MATLEEVIKQRLAAASAEQVQEATVAVKQEEVVVEAEKKVDLKSEDDTPPEDKETVVDTKPTMKKTVCKEDTVSAQVSAILEAEGLSDEFKAQAVTIFEAAVTDRVLQIEEELKKDFDVQLAEAKKTMEDDIDGFLSEAIAKWQSDNEVAIKSNFKSQLAESFMDGMFALLAEHNIELDADKEDALKEALSEVDKLQESATAKEAEMLALVEEVSKLKGKQILESFKEKMTSTEFDRFVQLTESVKFIDEAQYEKQLTVVMENFGSKPKKPEAPAIVEEVVTVPTVITEASSNMDVYTQYLSKKK